MSETEIYTEDTRHSYPERRFVTVGYLNDRLHVLCFTPIVGGIRVIRCVEGNKCVTARISTNLGSGDILEWLNDHRVERIERISMNHIYY